MFLWVDVFKNTTSCTASVSFIIENSPRTCLIHASARISLSQKLFRSVITEYRQDFSLVFIGYDEDFYSI